MMVSMTWDASRPAPPGGGCWRPSVPSEAVGDVLAELLDSARDAALRWASRAPPWMDRDAFVGEALAAVATAIHRYRTDRGTTLSDYAAGSVYRALQHEWRRQTHRSGEGTLPWWGLEPLSLELLRGARECPDDRPGPEERALAGAQAERVRAAVASLPDRQLWATWRYFWEGATKAAIACEMGVSVPRVHQILHAAVAELGKILTAEEWS